MTNEHHLDQQPFGMMVTATSKSITSAASTSSASAATAMTTPASSEEFVESAPKERTKGTMPPPLASTARECIPTIIFSPVISPLRTLQRDDRMISYGDVDELRCKLQTMYQADYYNGMRYACMSNDEEPAASDQKRTKRTKTSMSDDDAATTTRAQVPQQPKRVTFAPTTKEDESDDEDDLMLHHWMNHTTSKHYISSTTFQRQRPKSLACRVRRMLFRRSRKATDHLNPKLSRPVAQQ
mmetsp:Transcript_6441/g.19024  ORF Transcript_6441/g.19024 Transcript_6441/m.19024 type:complete len:240 (-) Transcript_6441:146-865(-)|eukprot:CAMPEP_0119551342 /NCGR_PEP_ID=MMETSP1352-20130426/4622_1 /TAXON_ID=265584 /ORGANISM="Stauroneis constricta, Strain CCMP1120" /LENGTH=239 /DNA_ID=CAMNT_0007597377 /DNA_START=144 /DNA_END=866 /DNA_ORIENTATION=+